MTLPAGSTEEQYEEIAAIRAAIEPLLTRLETLGAEPQHHGSPATMLEEAWLALAGTFDLLGPYGVGRPNTD